MSEVKGFKVFNPDWTCRGFQYEVGQTCEENVIPRVCGRGFHFCKQARDCLNYYSFDPNNETGCFCTEEHKIRFFDQESEMTFREWRNSEAYGILCGIPFEPTRWIWADDMTDEEKASHPEYKTTDGYLKVCDTDKAFLTWWDSLNNREKEIIKSIPNFNAEKFLQISGIRV